MLRCKLPHANGISRMVGAISRPMSVVTQQRRDPVGRRHGYWQLASAGDVGTQGVGETADESRTSNSTSPETSAVSANSSKDDYFGAEELVQELTDPKQFGQRGEAWFFAQLATVALIIFPPIPLQGLVDLVGTLSLTSGLVFIIYALLSLGRNISPMPEPRKKHNLVKSGMYSYVRHPMYGGLIMASLGLAAVTRSEIRLALTALIWYILEQKVGYEEQLLSARYPEYEEYKAKVKKFIPFVY